MRNLKLPVFSLLLVLTPYMSHSESRKVFRFHIQAEPASLDPLFVQSSDASYFLNNVMRGLYSYSNEKGLVSEDAKSCTLESRLKLRCELKADVRWSDGSAVTAADYVRGFRRLIGSSSRSAAVELLKNLRNAVAIHGGKAKPESLGLRALSPMVLEFEFEKQDSDFLYKLAASVLVPSKTESFPTREKSTEAIVNGPYQVETWTAGRRVRLKPNTHYTRGRVDRPPVEVLFVEDDETAYNLYEQGELTFLRRLPTTSIPKAKSRKDFLQIPVARFDYLGFGPELKELPDLREALSHAADFAELQKIYDALGLPGCPSLPRRLMADEPCIKFDLARAKTAFAKLPESVRTKRYKLVFSKLGGDDIKKGAEWWQAQWKKHLGFTVDLESSEQGSYLAMLRQNPPAIFRKGIGLDRPTCLAALETFTKNGAENFVKFESAEYEAVVEKLNTNLPDRTRNKLCSQGISLLLKESRLIPLGRIHFTMLVRPEFKGWTLNDMNQLDLASLHIEP